MKKQTMNKKFKLRNKSKRDKEKIKPLFTKKQV